MCFKALCNPALPPQLLMTNGFFVASLGLALDCFLTRDQAVEPESVLVHAAVGPDLCPPLQLVAEQPPRLPAPASLGRQQRRAVVARTLQHAARSAHVAWSE